MSPILGGAFSPMLSAAVIALAVLSPLAIAPCSAQSGQPAADPVAAVVNGVQIRQSEVSAMVETLPAQYQQMPIQVLYPALLDRLIDGKLLGAAGRAKNMQNEADIKRKIGRAHV